MSRPDFNPAHAGGSASKRRFVQQGKLDAAERRERTLAALLPQVHSIACAVQGYQGTELWMAVEQIINPSRSGRNS